MKKFDFTKIAIHTGASGVAGIAGVEIDIMANKLPIPKPFVQLGKIAASIAATFFLPKNEIVASVASGMIGQSSAELYKTVTKRSASIGEIGAIDQIYVNENGVQTDAYGNPLVIEGIGYIDEEGNTVDEDGNVIEGTEGYQEDLIGTLPDEYELIS